MGMRRFYAGTATLVGAVNVFIALTVPRVGIIRRARAAATAGTGIPGSVSMTIQDANPASSPFGVFLAYSLTATAIDSEECVRYEATALAAGSYYGTLQIGVAHSDVTLDHTIQVQLDIESESFPASYGQQVF